MSQAWQLKNEQALGFFCDHIRHGWNDKHFPSYQELPVKRSLDQNAISHAWYKQIAVEKGDISPLDAKCISKLHCGVPMLLAEDENFRLKWDSRIKKHLTYEGKIEVMEFFTVTSLMSKKQLSVYLVRMQKYWGRQGIVLMFPDDYKNKYYEAG